MDSIEISAVYENIRERICSLTSDEKYDLVDEIYSTWSVKETSIPRILERSLENLGFTLDTITLPVFQRKFVPLIGELGTLKAFLSKEQKDEDPDNRFELAIRKINDTLKIVFDLDNTVKLLFSLKTSVNCDDEAQLSGENKLMSFVPENYSNNTHLQNLLIYISVCLKDDKLRRYNSSCYGRVYTPDGHDTHTWAEKHTLKDFIHLKTRRELKFDMWQNLTHSGSGIDNVVKYFSECKDLSFTDIKKNRHVFSFKNGIYFCCENIKDHDRWSTTSPVEPKGPFDTFVRYGEHVDENVISCKYFEKTLDTDIFDMEPFEIIKRYCPSFVSIMSYQDWSEDVQRWLCILIGRCLYDTGQLDNWQVVPFMLGQAGTGKSTICNFIVKLLYDNCDVSTLSNNIQKTFGLDTISDKFLFIAPEIKESFNLEQSEFQSMISGEAMSLSVKFKDPKNIPRWKVPGFMVGNEVPGYKDTAGSIPRRMVVFMFDKRVKKEDGDNLLGNKLKNEVPYILVACNKLYLREIEKNGTKDIWSILPKYFTESRETIAGSTNSLTNYLRSGKVKLGSKFVVHERELAEDFKNYCTQMNMGTHRWNHQFCMGPFSECGIVAINNHRVIDPYTGVVQTGVFYEGLTLEQGSHKDRFGNKLNADGTLVK